MSKKIYSIKGSSGVNLREGDKDTAQIGYVKNMLPENGINKKRRGWETICQITSEDFLPLKINGIFKYNGEIIVHAGHKLYKCSKDFSQREEIALGDGVFLKNEKSSAAVCKGSLWLCAGGLFVYDGDSVKRAYEIEGAYTPATTVGGSSVRQGGVGVERDSANLLTRKRINSFSVDKTDKGEHFFICDSPIDLDKPISITVTFRVRRVVDANEGYVSSYIGYNSARDEVNTVVTGKYYSSCPRENTMLKLQGTFKDPLGNPITPEFEGGSLVDYNELGWPILIKDQREIFIMFNPTTPKQNTDNIIVEYTTTEQDTEDLVNSFTYIAEATADNGNSVLVLCDGKSSLYYTDVAGRNLYLPYKNCITLGNDKDKITAVCHMLDNYIGVYKEQSFYRLRILSDSQEKYQVVATNDRQGSINFFSACSLEGDNICFNQKGVFGTNEPSEAYERLTVLYPRSGRIEKLISSYTQEELKDAFSLVHDGKYYLFIGSLVYVASSEHKVYLSEEHFEYEWWILDNCPISYAASIDKEMYMGREDGHITVFTRGYCDTLITELNAKSYHYLFNDLDEYTGAVFDDSLKIKDGDMLYLGKHSVFHSPVRYVSQENRLYIDKEYLLSGGTELCLYDKMRVKLFDRANAYWGSGEISDIDTEYGSLFCDGVLCTDDTELFMYIEKDGITPYSLKDEGEYFTLDYMGRRAKLLGFTIDKVQIRHKSPVVAELKTNRLYLDKRGEKKTLHGIVIYTTDDTVGNVEIGYETFNGSNRKTVTVGTGANFEMLDFSTLAFNDSYHGKRVSFFERGFEYVVVRLTSGSEQGFGVPEIGLIYTPQR